MTIGLQLLVMLLIILAAAQIFTDALEHLGERLGISEGVTGSVFAAVGTAMPESMVPIVAIFAGTGSAEVNAEIGVGAILGAPLMLSTLSLFLMALSVLWRRGAAGHLTPEQSGFKRDLLFFLIAYGIAITGLFIPAGHHAVQVAFAGALVVTYFVYLMLTFKVSSQLVANGHATAAHGPMLLCRLGLPQHMAVIVAQLVLGLALLIGGAKGFVHGVEEASALIGISALLLSLLIIPIATELPEKVNSIIWIRRGKDTLAFGNITGAMVFQGSLLPAIGLTLTPWQPNAEVLAGVLVTYSAGIWLFLLAHRGRLRVWHLFVNGVVYVSYVVVMLSR